AYTAIFSRCGLEFRAVEADSGNIGGSVTHEFHVLADSGEDTIAFCDSCDYAANVEKASARPPEAASVPADAPAPVEVATPGKTSIEDVASFLKIDGRETVKMLVYEVDSKHFVAVCLRGDLAVNEVKLRAALGAESVAIPADEVVKEKLKLAVGYLGPRNLPEGAVREVIADLSVRAMSASVCGANRDGFHLTNIYPSRDLSFTRFEDVSVAIEGDVCPRCSAGRLKMRKGIEVGQVFKLGEKYSKPMSLTYLDEKDSARLMTMGCYGIGVGRTAAAAIEQHHDENGIIWPAAIAPYTVAVLCLDAANPETCAVAKNIHDSLEQNGIDVLLDDRPERPGVKFKDADLIGFPFRVTVGLRGLSEGIVEFKRRGEKSLEKIPKDSCMETIVKLVKEARKG
ncbi:MAG TPA: proline--tRNA ligase, partial [Chitinivibrionales bacterium]|nr:proline--tRNA ligase [Chitinivibrionales bacterium]